MARPRSLSDADVSAQLLTALAETGEKGLTFGVMSQRCGLAPATLAQRFGSVDGMIRAALLLEWSRLSDAVSAIESEAIISSKGAQAVLKNLPAPTVQMLSLSLRDEELSNAAAAWRSKVESALAIRRGGGAKGREAAALIFAAWQGRQIWEAAGGKSFRLNDMLKALP